MEPPFKFSICNEVFQNSDFATACATVADLGYQGIELAPFTLAENAGQLSSADRKQILAEMEKHDLSFVGLHWLLVGPLNLHATSADLAVRRQTWQFLDSLIDLCSDLRTARGEPAVMVFGSPKQRTAANGISPEQAVQIMTEELSRLAPHAERAGVEILIEPLSPSQTNVVNTLEEATAMMNSIGSPAIRTMFDVHNAVDERRPHTELLKEFFPYIAHVHVNELDGREPGTGSYDFRALLSALETLNYRGWVSLEVFDFSRDPREIASRALEYLKAASGSATRV